MGGAVHAARVAEGQRAVVEAGDVGVSQFLHRYGLDAESVRDLARREFNELWHRYMASPEWMRLRRAILQRATADAEKRSAQVRALTVRGLEWPFRMIGNCERCFQAAGVDVHHETYIRRFQESPDDLLLVCRACHEFLSGRAADDPAERLWAFVEEMNVQMRAEVAEYEVTKARREAQLAEAEARLAKAQERRRALEAALEAEEAELQESSRRHDQEMKRKRAALALQIACGECLFELYDERTIRIMAEVYTQSPDPADFQPEEWAALMGILDAI